MSHSSGHIIIDGLIATDKFGAEDCARMQTIRAKERFSIRDALAIALMVFRRLRSKDHA